ncbi:MAG: biopolymer transporter ExbD [Lentisphaeria bacterium]|nr:biopolymer transporter ExbD [Victivallales bacterium]MCR4574028.1 biopolymer transporter ExbD [Lentisphaeria bacterium]
MRIKKNETLAVPMSSMIDIVFLLLIYFIVTMEDEIPEAHLAINLPSPGSKKENDTTPKLLELQVYKNELRLRGKLMSYDEIDAFFKRFSSMDKEATVLVQVSQHARAQELVTALDLCRKHGFNNLNVLSIND